MSFRTKEQTQTDGYLSITDKIFSLDSQQEEMWESGHLILPESKPKSNVLGKANELDHNRYCLGPC